MGSYTEKPDFLTLADGIGRVSCMLTVPSKITAAIVLAHGAGAGMQHQFMQRMAGELAVLHVATLRYNFPFIENKRKRPDSPVIAQAAVKSAIRFARQQFPQTPLFAGGKSFGGRMTSQFIAQQGAESVKGIVFMGFPLHPAGKPGVARGEHLHQVPVPMLFLQGTRDPLAEIQLIEQVCSDLKHATLVKIEQADHSFKVSKHDLLPVLARHTVQWMKTVLSQF